MGQRDGLGLGYGGERVLRNLTSIYILNSVDTNSGLTMYEALRVDA
jgi:hypothetical protein